MAVGWVGGRWAGQDVSVGARAAAPCVTCPWERVTGNACVGLGSGSLDRAAARSSAAKPGHVMRANKMIVSGSHLVKHCRVEVQTVEGFSSASREIYGFPNSNSTEVPYAMARLCYENEAAARVLMWVVAAMCTQMIRPPYPESGHTVLSSRSDRRLAVAAR